MEKFFTERVSPFEIKVGIESSRKKIKEKLSGPRKGWVQFIVVENFDIWVTDSGHDELRIENGIMWRDIIERGYLYLENGNLRIYYYDKNKKIKSEIDRKLRNFVDDLYK